MELFFVVLFVLVLLLNILACFSKKNRLTMVLYIGLLICMVIIAASQTCNNDYESYRSIYFSKNGWSGVEVGFLAFCEFCRDILVLPYESFRTLVFLIMFLVSGVSFWGLSKHPNMILVAYFILFFAINIVQIRYGLGEAFIYLSLLCCKKKKPLIAAAFVLLASCFHVTLLIFMSIVLFYYDKPRQWIFKHRFKIVVVSIALLLILRFSTFAIPIMVKVLSSMGTFIDGDSIRSAANFVSYDGNHYLKYLPVPFLMVALFNICEKDDEETTKFYEAILYLSLFIYPLFTINRLLSRLSRTYVMISVVYFSEKLYLNKRNQGLMACTCCLYFAFSFYALSAYTSCFEPLLQDSILSCVLL